MRSYTTRLRPDQRYLLHFDLYYGITYESLPKLHHGLFLYKDRLLLQTEGCLPSLVLAALPLKS